MNRKIIITSATWVLIIFSMFIVIKVNDAESIETLFQEGDGSLENPYRISNVTELQWMRNLSNLDKHFVLVNDIDASSTSSWNDGAGFVPIGEYLKDDSTISFSGSFDGNNYTISGLFINRSIGSYIGLFGHVGVEGQVKNIRLVDSNILGSNNVGALVGYNSGSMINCSAIGIVRNTASLGTVGGLVGINSGAILNCKNNGSVHGVKNVGGFIGVNSGTISNSHSIGRIIGTNLEIGGFIGENRGYVNNSFAIANVTGSRAGGFVGLTRSGIISDCYAVGIVNGLIAVGGFAGELYPPSIIMNCYSMCDVSCNLRYYGGFVGGNNWGPMNPGKGLIYNSHYNIDESLINGEKILTRGGLFDSQFKDWLSNDMTLNISNYKDTLEPNDGYYGIDDVQGIRDILGFAEFEGYRFRLSSDIDLSSDPGLFIPHFSASEFDGNDHTISNLSVEIPNDNLGLFGYNKDGTIKNTRIVNARIKGEFNLGILMGFNSGTVYNCHTEGSVTGPWDRNGGLIGDNNETGVVMNSHAVSNVIGKTYNGGLIGRNYGIVSSCHADGNTSGEQIIGGLVGHNNGMINSSYSIGNVSGNGYVGGLIGINSRVLNNTYSTGNVQGTVKAGGLVGDNYDTVSNSYSVGRVEGNTSVGGLVGSDSGTVSDSFWDISTSGQISSAGGTGKTTAEMKTRRTYTDAGWDFDRVWYILEEETYPFFKWQDSESPKAFAGPDQIVDEGTVVVFDGSGSTDNYEIINWTWTFIDGDQVVLYGVDPSYRFDTPGLFDVTLKVTDGNDNWDTDIMTVTVRDITIPVSDAGPDLIIDEGTVVTFNGNGSYDNVGIVNYTWSFIDGDPIVLYGVDPSYQFNTPRVYIVTLNVSDAAGHWATDTMTVTVRDITAPIAVAGSDLTVDEGTVVYFDGSESSDNVGIVNYTWTFVDGEIIMLTGMDPSYRFDTPGVYTVVLNVTDASGHWGVDSMIVTVLDITAPKAVAGLNRTVDEGTVETFDGSGSYDNVGIENWTWAFIDGDPIVLYGVDPSYRFDTPGVYTVVLNVTDAAGLWSIDSLTVTVRDITPPVADAGEDRIIDEGETFQFDGSGSNDNVGIVNYTWSFYDGSSSVMLYGISPSHTFSISGIYVVTLTVTDEAGNEGSDTMTVEVKEKEGNGIENGPDNLWLFILGSIFVVVVILLIGWFLLFRRKKNGEEE